MVAKFCDLKVTGIEALTSDSCQISFEVPEALAPVFAFQPGQYLTLRADVAGVDIRRAYSICSAPGEPLSVGIRRVEEGVFSSFATSDLTVGDVLRVMPPQGRFVASIGAGEHYLLCAAGSGITPILSIAKAALVASKTASVTLIYGNRSTASIMFREAIEALKNIYLSRFQVIHVLSRETGDVSVLEGRIDGEKLRALSAAGVISPRAADGIFLCGPVEMIDLARAEFIAMGADPDAIHDEKFLTADGEIPAARPRSTHLEARENGVTVGLLLDGAMHHVTVTKSDASVLDAAARAGLELPYSCRGGDVLYLSVQGYFR